MSTPSTPFGTASSSSGSSGSGHSNAIETIGDYILLAEIARTKKHIIYNATHPAKPRCILKKYARVIINMAEIEELRKEYCFLQRCDSPFILKVYDLVNVEGTSMIVEEYAEGLPLISFTVLSPDDVIRIAIDLCKALDHLHRQRHIIHCDLNPSNIMYAPSTRKVTIIDFNSAKSFDDNESVESFTLQYMSPEQSHRFDYDVDYRTDFYSLGITLFRILSGTFPFEAQDELDYIQAHIAAPPKKLSTLRPDLHPSISEIISILLQKSPMDRYQSATGLEHDFQTVLECMKRRDSKQFELRTKDYPFYFRAPGTSYGRKEQIEKIQAYYNQALETKTPVMVVLSGQGGIGKTALVHRFRQLQNIKYFAAGRVADVAGAAGKPFDAFRQVLESIAFVLMGSSEQVQATFVRRVLACCRDSYRVLFDFVPAFANMFKETRSGTTPLKQEDQVQRLQQIILACITSFSLLETEVAVLGIENLHSLDASSVQILELLLKQKTPVFILGTIRENELSATHEWRILQIKSKENDLMIKSLSIPSITFDDIVKYISDSIPSDPYDMQTLAKIVFKTTAGNPLFLSQFLNSLYLKQLIEFDPVASKWKYMLNEIDKMEIPANIVDYCIDQLKEMDRKSQEVLAMGSLYGMNFSVDNILLFSPTSTRESILRILDNAIEKKFIRFLGSTYQFSHERIQKTCFERILPLETRKELHFLLAQNLLNVHLNGRPSPTLSISAPPAKESTNIIDIIFHLQQSDVSKVIQCKHLDEICRLFISGAAKIQVTSLPLAVEYLATCKTLLETAHSPDPWVKRDLMMETLLSMAEYEILSSRAQRADELTTGLQSRLSSKSEIVRYYKLKSMVASSKGNFFAVTQIGKECLSRLSLDIPDVLSTEEAIGKLSSSLYSNFRPDNENVDLNALYVLPFADNDLVHASIVQFVLDTVNGFYISGDTPMSLYLYGVGVDIVMKGGITAFGLALLSGAAFSMCAYGQDYNLSTKLIEVIVKLMSHYPEQKGVWAIVATIRAWHSIFLVPVVETTQYFEDAIRTAANGHDPLQATFALVGLSWTMIIGGVPLDQAIIKCESHASVMNFRKGAPTLSTTQLLSHLMYFFRESKIPFVTEKQYTDFFTAGQSIPIANASLIMAIKDWHSGDYQRALTRTDAMLKHRDSTKNQGAYFLILLYTVLILSKKFQLNKAEWTNTDKLNVEYAVAELSKMSLVAQNHTFKPFVAVCKAELALQMSDYVQSFELYEQGYGLALRSHNYLLAGIAKELATDLATKLDLQDHRILAIYDCLRAYKKFKATEVVSILEARHNLSFKDLQHEMEMRQNDLASENSGAGGVSTTTTTTTIMSERNSFPSHAMPTLLPSVPSANNTSTAHGNSISDAIDVRSLLRAADTISHATDMQKLRSVLPKLLMTQAGATRLVLIEKLMVGNGTSVATPTSAPSPLEIATTIVLDAKYDADGQLITADTEVAVQSVLAANGLPKSIINASLTSFQPLYVRDALVDATCQNDPYVKASHCRSLFTHPILYQNDVIGILYLEHDSMPNMYSPQRNNDVLNILSSQIASCLANARLHKEVERMKGEMEGLVATNKVEFESPLEKATQIVKHLQKVNTDSNQQESLNLLLQLLTSSEILLPNMKQIERGLNLDKDSQDWVLATMTNQKLKIPNKTSTMQLDTVAETPRTKERENSPISRQMMVYRIFSHADPKASTSEKGRKSSVDFTRYRSFVEKLDTWNFPLFDLTATTGNHCLLFMSYHLFEERKFFEQYSMDIKLFMEWCLAIENGYGEKNPYHNREHGADVLHASHCFSLLPKISSLITPLETLALYVAAAMHDVDHPGKSNVFLVNSKHELAIMYNDRSVLENHHASTGFALMTKYNFLSHLSDENWKRFRKSAIDIVLATDLQKHFEYITTFKRLVLMKEDADFSSDEVRIILWQMIIKCADVSNGLKELDIYTKWVDRVFEEFFRQGEEEQRLGLTVSPMCDRATTNIPKCQMTFIDYLCKPLFESFHEYAGIGDKMSNMKNNHRYWDSLNKITETTDAAAPGSVTNSHSPVSPATASSSST